jgi:hypothetical protein
MHMAQAMRCVCGASPLTLPDLHDLLIIMHLFVPTNHAIAAAL